MSSSEHIDNEIKDILIIREGLTERLNDTTLKQKLNILLISHNQEKYLY